MDEFKTIFAEYNPNTQQFNFSKDINEDTKNVFESRLDLIKKDIESLESIPAPYAKYSEFAVSRPDGSLKNYIIGYTKITGSTLYSIVMHDISSKIEYSREMRYMIDFDSLTELFNKDTFCRRVDMITLAEEAKRQNGKLAMIYLDILHFKAINELFGLMTADGLLKHVSKVIREFTGRDGFGCRVGSDRFCVFVECSGTPLEEGVKNLIEQISNYMPTYKIICNVGIYVSTKEELSAQEMMGRAILAQSLIKGSVSSKINYYKEEMRNAMLTEQEITGLMNKALLNKEFVVYYQPQYNHSTKGLVGAEALVRWLHPEKGLISPASFIPIFENNGFITNLDMYVFEQACILVSQRLKENKKIVPVSTNFSRHDLFDPEFVSKLENIRRKYNVECRYLRIEITESSLGGETDYINSLIKQLHACGYIVEMDDFGSGYSSLNTLKDIDFDIIKLDMKFMSESASSGRGGTILSSVVRMANWLKMPVIAEGVETQEQADFLKSIGSDFIQGYFYSKPLCENDFVNLLDNSSIDHTNKENHFESMVEGVDLWDPKSQNSLIFNNFIGPAVIFEYKNGVVELTRVNQKYLKEIGMNESEREVLLQQDTFAHFTEEDKQLYIKTIQLAIDTKEEQICETVRTVTTKSCGTAKLNIRSYIILLGQSKENYLFYARIRNITNECSCGNNPESNEAAVFHWEYVVGEKTMYPCERCRHDLGLPEKLLNYPEPVIESGLFPWEIAGLYRDWHKQIESGKVSHLEAVLPLTEARIMHHVQYDVEFNEIGQPVKAYGSANPVKE